MTNETTQTDGTAPTLAEYKQQLRNARSEMKRRGIRIISCFNGGLTSEERNWNTELFRLKTEILRAGQTI